MGRWGALVVLCLTMFVVVLDTSMMNVAVPQITTDLNTTVSAVQAVIALYSLVMASLMLAGAKLGKIHGAKKVFRISLWIYGAGTLIATFSPNIEILALGWSVIEGVAAAALVPLSMSLIIVNYSGAKRALAFGVLGGFQATAAAVGPIFGGFLTTQLTWRAGFAFEVVIVVVVLALLKHLKGAPADRTQTLDWVGTGLSVVGLGSIVIGALLAGRHGWWTARRPLQIGEFEIAPLGLSITPWLLLTGVVFLGLFAWRLVLVERSGRTPLVDPAIFKVGRFVTGFTTDALQSVALAGLLFVVPLFLQQTLGLDALGAGVVLLPLSVSVLCVSLLTPSWSRWIQAKYLIIIGASTMVIGVVGLMLAVEEGMSEWDMTIPLLIFGAGTGLLLAQVPNLTMSAVAPNAVDDAAGVQNSAKELGTSLGTAIIGSVLLVSTMTAVVSGVSTAQGAPVAPGDLDHVVVEYEDALDELSANQKRDFYAELDESVGGQLTSITEKAQYDAMNAALLTLGVFVVLALIAALFLPKGRLADKKNPPDPEKRRYDKRAPYPERGT
jgi:EmrB/QacA subfamily drug resistance transporter